MPEKMGERKRHKSGFYPAIWQELLGGTNMKARDKRLLIVGFMGGFIGGLVVSLLMVLMCMPID